MLALPLRPLWKKAVVQTTHTPLRDIVQQYRPCCLDLDPKYSIETSKRRVGTGHWIVPSEADVNCPPQREVQGVFVLAIAVCFLYGKGFC